MPKNFPCTAANLIRNTPSPWYSDSSIYYKFCWSYFEFTSEYPAGEYRLILFYGSCCVDSRFHNLHMYPKIRVMFKWYLYLPATAKGHFDLQQARDRKIDILIVDVDKQACGGMAMGCAPNSQEWWACELLQSWTMTHFLATFYLSFGAGVGSTVDLVLVFCTFAIKATVDVQLPFCFQRSRGLLVK